MVNLGDKGGPTYGHLDVLEAIVNQQPKVAGRYVATLTTLNGLCPTDKRVEAMLQDFQAIRKKYPLFEGGNHG